MMWAGLGVAGLEWTGQGCQGWGKPCPYIYDVAFEYRHRARVGIILALALLFLFVGSDEREAFQFMEHMHLSYRRFGAVDSQSHLIR
jgi:hypothetical protein